jgi:HSP20 family protein
MSLIKYNPNLSPLFNNFDDLLSIFDAFDPMTRPVQSVTGPRTNVQNLEDKHLIELATPGVEKEELNIDIDDGRLTVSFHQEKGDEKRNFQRAFKRSWTLPKDVDVDNINADYANGVLAVSIPKTAPATPPQRRIQIG